MYADNFALVFESPKGTTSIGVGPGGTGRAATGIVSRIKDSPKLIRGAEAAGRSTQQSIDALTAQLARGNLNPGIGTRPIGKGISEARARDGARVYFRQGRDGTIEILGKSTKANQQSVIDEVLRVFGD
jgi:putative component of toxin-antitoxin plasmid stabilization module